MCELLLVRHALTEGNELHRYVGRRTDEPLGTAGVAQCRVAGAFPEVKEVFVSPMLRARQTAELCFPEARLVQVPGLEEFDFGDFEGRGAADMEHDAAYREWVDGWCRGMCPGGESLDGFIRRTSEALWGVVSRACDMGERRVVVVAHGGTIMAAMHSFCHEDVPEDDYFGWAVGNCEGYLVDVRVDEGQLFLTRPRRVWLEEGSL